jgi:hypothetical protein
LVSIIGLSLLIGYPGAVRTPDQDHSAPTAATFHPSRPSHDLLRADRAVGSQQIQIEPVRNGSFT